MQDSDMLNTNSQLEHPQADHVGTGHSDQGQFVWAVDINWDFYASCIGRHPMLAYIALSENESIGRERHKFMQKLRPVVRENNNASEVLSQYSEHAPNTSDTNTDTDTDSDNSRPSVRSSPCRTAEAVLSDQKEDGAVLSDQKEAEAVLSDQKEPSEPSKSHNPGFHYAKETGLKTAAEAVLSDQKEPSERSKARIPGLTMQRHLD